MDFVREDPDPRTWSERAADLERARRPAGGAPRLYCSAPRWYCVETLSRTLVVSGWVTAESGPTDVTVTVDGGDPYPVKAEIRLAHAARLGSAEEWSGWGVVIDAEE